MNEKSNNTVKVVMIAVFIFALLFLFLVYYIKGPQIRARFRRWRMSRIYSQFTKGAFYRMKSISLGESTGILSAMDVNNEMGFYENIGE